MVEYKEFKLNAVPVSWEPNSVYYILTGNFITIYVTSGTGVPKQLTPTDLSGKVDKVGTEDIEITDNTNGLILLSPNSTRFRITVNNDGSLETTII